MWLYYGCFFCDGKRTGKIGKIQKFGVGFVFPQYFLQLFIFAYLHTSIEQGDVKEGTLKVGRAKTQNKAFYDPPF